MQTWAVYISVFASVLGTSIGGGLGSVMLGNDRRMGSFLLEFSAGLMLSVVCFDMLPVCLETVSLPATLSGILMGLSVMFLSDIWIRGRRGQKVTTLTQTGLSLAFGVALHNFPEGLAIGSGFGVNTGLGFALTLAVALHDIPEGISIAIPLRMGKVKRSRVFLLTFLSGLPMALGALLGMWAGQISKSLVTLCLSLASGAMIYIVMMSMIPESKRMYKGRIGSAGGVLGLLAGLVLSTVLH